MVPYENSCVCGKSYTNNCAHFLSNWMIRNGEMSKNPSGTSSGGTCAEGRPIRAKDFIGIQAGVKGIWQEMGMTCYKNPPGGNCYIYCERQSDHQGHVYYGTKDNCVAGTTGSEWAGSDAYIRYFK